MTESKNALFYMFNDDELEVCDILLNLEHLVHVFSLPLNWGTKRKRSSLIAATTTTSGGGSGPISPHHQHHHGGDGGATATSSQSTSLQIADVQKDDNKVQKSVEDKVEATSPSTPLSFYPSESDDTHNSKHSLLKTSKKMTREELLETVKELTQSREVLKNEVKNVESYYKQLKAFNMELKAKKREMLIASKRCEVPVLAQNQIMSLGSEKREEGKCVTLPLFTSSTGNGNVGPRGIPDLNVSVEEGWVMESSQPFNYGGGGINMGRQIFKAETAENRKRRRLIMSFKRNEQQSR